MKTSRWDTPRAGRWALIALLAVGSLWPLFLAGQLYNLGSDDAFISFAYARSLAEGRGFVFNHPPASLGSTTPLFCLALAALSRLSGLEPPAIAPWLSALLWIGSAWLFVVFRRAWRFELWESAIMALVVLATGNMFLLCMEGFLFQFVIFSAFSFYLAGWSAASGAAVFLAFLTRGEGALAAPLLFLACLWPAWQRATGPRQRRFVDAGLFAAGFSLPFAVWAAYSSFAFGSIFPNTMEAKIAHRLSGLYRSFAGTLPEYLLSWGRQFDLYSRDVEPWGNVPVVNLWWILILAGAVYTVHRRRQWLLPMIWTAFFVAAYCWMGVPEASWYPTPVWTCLNCLAALGLAGIVAAGMARTGWRRGAIVAAGAVLTGIVVFRAVAPSYSLSLRAEDDFRRLPYQTIAQWLRENTAPDASVAYIEIGFLGYYSERRIIDLAGLLQPEAAPHIARNDWAWLFYEKRPDYYVYFESFDWVLKGIRADPRFDELYEPVATLPSLMPKKLNLSRNFVIYARRDLVEGATTAGSTSVN